MQVEGSAIGPRSAPKALPRTLGHCEPCCLVPAEWFMIRGAHLHCISLAHMVFSLSGQGSEAPLHCLSGLIVLCSRADKRKIQAHHSGRTWTMAKQPRRSAQGMERNGTRRFSHVPGLGHVTLCIRALLSKPPYSFRTRK